MDEKKKKKAKLSETISIFPKKWRKVEASATSASCEANRIRRKRNSLGHEGKMCQTVQQHGTMHMEIGIKELNLAAKRKGEHIPLLSWTSNKNDKMRKYLHIRLL